MCLTPSQFHSITLMDNELLKVFVEILLFSVAVENDIREQAAALEKIEGMCDVLGSEHIKGEMNLLASTSLAIL